jgi:hypothetical protein
MNAHNYMAWVIAVTELLLSKWYTYACLDLCFVYVYKFVLFLSFALVYFMIGLWAIQHACKQTNSWINNITTIYSIVLCMYYS